jgi:hypothetical protein
MRALLVIFLFALISGCSNVQPWVMPYERGALADPIMSYSRDPMLDRYRQHVFEVREGARGGSGVRGGGCGCN